MIRNTTLALIFTAILALLFASIIGISEYQKEPTFEGSYTDKELRFFISFKDGMVTVKTPEGSLTKTFEQKENHLELLYWDAKNKETILQFTEDDLHMQLYCKKCAKFQLPSHWYLDVLDVGKTQ